MEKFAFFLVAGLFLSACQSFNNVELPTNNHDGADQLKLSPCACEQLEFDGRGFKWREAV